MGPGWRRFTQVVRRARRRASLQRATILFGDLRTGTAGVSSGTLHGQRIRGISTAQANPSAGDVDERQEVDNDRISRSEERRRASPPQVRHRPRRAERRAPPAQQTAAYGGTATQQARQRGDEVALRITDLGCAPSSNSPTRSALPLALSGPAGTALGASPQRSGIKGSVPHRLRRGHSDSTPLVSFDRVLGPRPDSHTKAATAHARAVVRAWIPASLMSDWPEKSLRDQAAVTPHGIHSHAP